MERVDFPGGGNVLHAHLFVNAGLYQLSQRGAGIGVKLTVIYSSGGRLVAVQSTRQRLGALTAKGLDSETVRCKMTVPFGANRPDAGTQFTARAQVFTL